MTLHLVLIETSGNQNYIFATNKLRENVGASELTYQAGTKLVCEAVKAVAERDIPDDLTTECTIDSAASKGVEVIIATSGKALLLTTSSEVAKKIVAHVTTAALQTMPGLTIHGAITEIPDLAHIHQAVGDVHRNLEKVRSRIPSNEQRFLRLPWMASCATSGLPAQTTTKEGENEILVSKLSLAKRQQALGGQKRLEKVVRLMENELALLKNIEELEKTFKPSWLAVIHADGNGLGEVFLNFNAHSQASDGRDYINQYRAFSLELDECTAAATATALKKLQEHRNKHDRSLQTFEVPVIPLVLGGDDLTVMCDGHYALKFTVDFLRAFEAETESKPTISQIAQKAFGRTKLGICAGIAIVKPHYPFHQAYELAEQLLKSAKKVKEKIQHKHNGKDAPTPMSALDFHILYDSKSSELDELREKMTVGESILTAKPYIVSAPNKPANSSWGEKRQFSELSQRVEAMRARDKNDPSKRALPSSQLHALREALFFGHVEANAQMQLIRERYKDKGLEKLLCDESLFFPFEGEHYTHFMDALDAVEFWKGFDDSNAKGAAGNE